MKPSGRRRVERAIQKIMQEDGDRCSLCKTPLQHNSKTFGGATSGGVPALAGECCSSKIKVVVVQGVYVNRNYDGFHQNADVPRDKPFLAPEIPKAVDRLQQHFAAIDNFGSGIAKRGGVRLATPRLHTADSAWKADDAAWFKANPSRSHRLRPAFRGEFDPQQLPAPPPPGHEYEALVRQVEPGQRIRTAFARNLEAPIPDIEEVLHALFDIASGAKNGVVTAGEVADLAKRYEPSKSSGQKTD